MRQALCVFCILLLASCAGRSPDPVDTVKSHDQEMTCDQIIAEAQSHKAEVVELESEQDWKVAQNVAAATVGAVLLWPMLFAMDFQNAAGKEQRALVQRMGYLAELAQDKCDKDEIAQLQAAFTAAKETGEESEESEEIKERKEGYPE